MSLVNAGRVGIAGTLLISVLMFFLCCPTPGVAGSLRIGATVSLEGAYQDLSYMVRSGYELWASEVNRQGGLLGRKVELVFYNDKSNPELVGPLYERLISEDRVDLVLSPYGSTLTMEAARITEKYGYILLAASASSNEIWDNGFHGVFGVYSTADRYFLGFLDLVARRGFKNVAVIYSNTTFNIATAHGVHKWAKLFGLDIVLSKQYERHEEELPAMVENLGHQSLDALVFCGYPPEGYLFLKLLEQHEFRPPALAVTIIPAMPDFYDRVGSFAEGVFGPSQWEADERLPFPGTADFIVSFEQKTGKKPSYQACASYSACRILEQAIIHAGEINHVKLRAFVSNLDTVTILGRFKVDFEGRQIGHNPILVQWLDGEKEIVYPTKMRTAPARLGRR